MTIASVNIHDPGNLGDQVCNPCDYFPEIQHAERVNAWKKIYPDDSHLILGGGGMIHGELIDAIRQIPRTEKRKLIWWGGGHNIHGQTQISYSPDWLHGFNLIGVRDHGAASNIPHEYVPCASCMHYAFDRVEIHQRFDVVIYEHKSSPIPLNLPFRLTNDKRQNEFEAVLSVLAGASAVITNTYHGAYWSLLLGKRVVIYKPFSSRFYGFRPKVLFCDENNWISQLALSNPAEDYLEECRDFNRQFAMKVLRELCA